jgi:uncharacterized membrane protein
MKILINWFWIFFVSITTVISAILVQHYLYSNNAWYLLVLSVISNSLMIIGYYQIFKQSFTTQFVTSKILSVIILFFYGLFVFKERISIKNYIGIAFSLITIYLLN